MASKKYLIEYFTQDELAYTNRKRYKTFEYVATSSEYQYAVKLGDGASTSVKTAIDNLCNYVRISLYNENNVLQFSTRWYVTSYIYHNGGQIEMFLQRDVIGENGLDGFFGKVERGYTETFLRNRKELSLNQRLINRLPLISQNNNYGTYSVDNHNNEMWGILYLTKRTEIDTSTGTSSTAQNPTINIAGLSPEPVSYEPLADGYYIYDNINITYIYVSFVAKVGNSYFYYGMKLYYDPYTQNYSCFAPGIDGNVLEDVTPEPGEPILLDVAFSVANNSYATDMQAARAIWNYFDGKIGRVGCPNTANPSYPNPKNYNDVIINDGGVYKKYTMTETTITMSANSSIIKDYIQQEVQLSHISGIYTYHDEGGDITSYSPGTCTLITYNYVELEPADMGTFTIDISQQMVDEPFICYVCPLYDVTLTENKDVLPKVYNIQKENAFQLFNSIVESCSGENSYLVDAQIYPYCPVLTTVSNEFKIYEENGTPVYYPIFNIASTSFSTDVKVQLKPYMDVKKEYIKRDYFLVSPEKSSNVQFNFYDYVDEFIANEDDEKLNNAYLNLIIKTALKPMNIISSAVITPSGTYPLKGITYTTDLRGCQATGGGFEVTLATDKFQEYSRNNSNYQAIFSLQQEELKRSHRVEQSNEIASIAMNTLSATMMGAIGGAALADYSYFGSSAKGAGAVIGAAVAGTTVGVTMGEQKRRNDELRLYEEYLQKQNFDLQIGTIKNIPNTVSRISSFNEIIMREFYYVIEIYECSTGESEIVDNFIDKYSYQINIFGNYEDFEKDGWFLKGTLITSNLLPIQHNVAQKEIMGGIYYYE